MGRTNFYGRTLARCLTWMLALSLLLSAATAETERGNLEDRFADVIPQMEYNGETYYLRSRLSALMVTGVLPDEGDGLPRTDFVALFVIDDNQKRITPIYIDGQVIVDVDGDSLPLREVYALGQNPAQNCERMLAAVDGLLGGELVESYMAVDLEGITGIAEFSMLEGNTRERLHLLRLALQGIPSKQLNQMYGAMSAYLTTDMKSGAVMRVIDKTDRYEIAETVDLPVLPAEGDGGTLQPDAARILDIVIDLFFDTEFI